MLYSRSHTVAGAPVPGQRRARLRPRVPHRVPCRLRWRDPGTGTFLAQVGQTINLSAAGVAVRLACEIPPGTWVEALLPRQEGDPTFLSGTVAHCQRVLADVFEIGIALEGEWVAGAHGTTLPS